MLRPILPQFLANVMIFWANMESCKWNAAYLPEIWCKKYIVIKNRTIEKLLIPRRVGSDRFVDPWDYDKMSIVGLIGYIVMIPINILNFIMQILYEFNYKSIRNIENLSSYIIPAILATLFIINTIVFIINAWNCGRK